MLLTEDLSTAYICYFLFSLTSPMWNGPAATTVNDLVLPRMRALASACFVLMNTFVGLALGPYAIGQISDIATTSGKSASDGLTTGMTMGLSVYAIAFIMIAIALVYVQRDQANRLEFARSVGEDVKLTT